MADKLIDIYSRILKYDKTVVYIAFHSKTSEPYFHAKQVCKLMEYEKPTEAIQTNVSKENVFYLKDIVKNYKSLYPNVQGNTKFLNEAGLYSLILKGKKKISEEIFKWITNDVLPSLRKHGEYRLNHDYKKKIDELEKILNEKKNEIEVLKHNQKKQKFKKEDAVYIMRVITNNLNFDEDEIIDIKFGKTEDLNKRKPTYDSCTKNKVQIIKTIYVKDRHNIENCVKKKMEKYQIVDKKEYFSCSYNQIIDEISSCVLFFEEKDIDKTPDIKNMSRQNVPFFDKDKKFMVRISDDSQKNNECSDSETSDSDTDTDSLSDLLSPEEDLKSNIQSGGTSNINLKYNICCLKILEIKYDTEF